jgi:carboxylate-amine ligase
LGASAESSGSIEAVGASGDQVVAALLDGVAERFERSVDFTVGLEEEYQLLDPANFALVNRFEELRAAAPPPFADRLAGELISSEIEVKTGRNTSFADAAREVAEGRLALIDLAESLGIGIGIGGVHPFSPWQDQEIIDTPHYARVVGELGYIAWINNTWSIHLHVGVRGADRAVAVSTALRSVLPELLALSANSPIYLGRDTGLHSTRTQIFTRSFPRCGIPDAYGTWADYSQFVETLAHTGAIVESTQIWWSVRPHHSYGTVEIRICDGQSELDEALALAALGLACTAAFCRDYDAGRPLPAHARALIEENLWRAQRHGLEGELIDFGSHRTRPAGAAVEQLLAWSEDVHGPLGLEPFLAPIADMLRSGNGAVRQRRIFAETADPVVIVAESLVRTRRSAEEILERMGVVATR